MSRKGPLNRRSLGFARDDKGRAVPPWRAVAERSETADPSASLGMTKGRAMLPSRAVAERSETADPSASLGMTKGRAMLLWIAVAERSETADPSASLGMTRGGRCFHRGRLQNGVKLQSLGFARDDKGRAVVLESGYLEGGTAVPERGGEILGAPNRLAAVQRFQTGRRGVLRPPRRLCSFPGYR